MQGHLDVLWGSGKGKGMDPLLKAIRDISDSDIETALTSCLKATTTTNSGATAPDYRTRLATSQLILQYRIGRPREADQEDAPKAESIEAVLARAKSSPAYRASMIAAYSDILDKLQALS